MSRQGSAVFPDQPAGSLAGLRAHSVVKKNWKILELFFPKKYKFFPKKNSQNAREFLKKKREKKLIFKHAYPVLRGAVKNLCFFTFFFQKFSSILWKKGRKIDKNLQKKNLHFFSFLRDGFMGFGQAPKPEIPSFPSPKDMPIFREKCVSIFRKFF